MDIRFSTDYGGIQLSFTDNIWNNLSNWTQYLINWWELNWIYSAYFSPAVQDLINQGNTFSLFIFEVWYDWVWQNSWVFWYWSYSY